MLQQTQALRVVPYYERWLARFPDAARARRGAARATCSRAWSGLGYNRRALALQRRGAAWSPRDGWPDDLTALPGVGPYTAAAVGVVRVGRAGRGGRHQRAPRARAPRRRRARAARARRARAQALLPAGPRGDVQPGDDGARRDGLPPARAATAAACPVARGLRRGRGRPRRAAARRAARFEDTDRWARGRVVAALLAGERAAGRRRAARARAGGARARRPDRPRPRRRPRGCRDARPVAGPILSDRGSGRDRAPRLPDRPPGLRPGGGGRAPAPRRRRVRGARAHPPPSTLCGGTSEQVRADPRGRRAQRRRAARARPASEAADHVARVAGGRRRACSRKLDALESELEPLLDGAARAAASGSIEGLAELQAQVGAAPRAAGRRREPARRPRTEPAPLAGARSHRAAPTADEAGARLIALNMALERQPREETARYLAEHFALADPDALLDDVYARAGR